MASVRILYGIRNGEFVHVDDVESGLACECTCPKCHRPLVAKKGEHRAKHFAHEADEVSCNPTPESLVHSYAKQQVAKLQRLVLPGFDVHAQYQAIGGEIRELFWRHRPNYVLQPEGSEEESTRFEGVVPDVLFSTGRGWLAVEVYFRHAVPPEKLEKLLDIGLSTVELDLSDLPVNASAATIKAAVCDVRRCTWLVNRFKVAEEYSLQRVLAHSTRIHFPERPSPIPEVAGSRVPSKLLRDADTRGSHANAQRLDMELRELPAPLRPQRLQGISREIRLALHCLQIGIRPTQLPNNLMQSVLHQSAFGVTPVLWQTGVFAKFCMVGGKFTAKQAAFWVQSVFPSLDDARRTVETANGFNDYSDATHNFLNYLGAQGLVKVIKGNRPWEACFTPIAQTKTDVLEALGQYPAALAS